MNLPVLFIQILKFAAVGVINTAVDFFILNLLLSFKFFRKRAIWANTISVSVAIINSYFWNKYWTFASGSTANYVVSVQFSLFVIVSLVGLAINNGVMFSILKYIFPKQKNRRLYINAAKLVAVFVAMVWNFIAYRFFVFANP